MFGAVSWPGDGRQRLADLIWTGRGLSGGSCAGRLSLVRNASQRLPHPGALGESSMNASCTPSAGPVVSGPWMRVGPAVGAVPARYCGRDTCLGLCIRDRSSGLLPGLQAAAEVIPRSS